MFAFPDPLSNRPPRPGPAEEIAAGSEPKTEKELQTMVVLRILKNILPRAVTTAPGFTACRVEAR